MGVTERAQMVLKGLKAVENLGQLKYYYVKHVVGNLLICQKGHIPDNAERKTFDTQ